jgi:hypothetical protein
MASFNCQFNSNVSIVGSKGWTEEQKSRLLGRTLTITVNGMPLTATVIRSSSGGLTCKPTCKVIAELGGPKVVETKAATMASANEAVCADLA